MPIRDFEAQRFRVLLVACLLFGFAGCRPREVAFTPQPRPVTVTQMTLKSDPEAILVSASVGSWKQEQIGFEIDGRIIRVIEPSKDIEGRIVDAEGNLLAPGTKIAGIDPERYDLLVRRAAADVEQFTQRIKAAEIELKEDLQFRKRAANAELKLALAEYDRTEGLFNRQAASKSELDKAETQLASARAAVDQLIAAEGAKQAELDSLKAQRAQAMESQRDAERNLENCTLYSSFDGQVAEVNVVPGSVVSPGQPVATVQMMNPIKIEVEVSAAQSREIQKLRQVPITFQAPNEDKSKEALAFVYLVDPAADLVTRTFTVTLLVINEQFDQAFPADLENKESVARAEDVWPANLTTVVGGVTDESRCTFEKGSIYVDEAQKEYVWVVTNCFKGEPLKEVLEVEKAYIKTLGPSLPFLGNWEFTPGKFLDSALAARADDLLVAGAFADSEQSNWDRKRVFVDSGKQWELRPGDLVTANVSEQQILDWYVPAEYIFVDAAKQAYLFLVEESKGDSESDEDDERKYKATRVRIDLAENAYGNLSNGELIRFSPGEEAKAFFEGGAVIIVSIGVQFLIDEEQINVT